jgi:hypothetical protein
MVTRDVFGVPLAIREVARAKVLARLLVEETKRSPGSLRNGPRLNAKEPSTSAYAWEESWLQGKSN